MDVITFFSILPKLGVVSTADTKKICANCFPIYAIFTGFVL
jgi:hypothetical protein